MFEIVNTQLPYDYCRLCEDVKVLCENFPALAYTLPGRTRKGSGLYLLTLGRGEKKIFLNGGHHGMEWVTSLWLMAYTESILHHQEQKEAFFGVDISMLFQNLQIFMMPMVNPDGIELALHGAKEEEQDYAVLFAYNKNSPDFSSWQANAGGIDLNHNYDAGFEKAKAMEQSHGITGPGRTRYGGEFAFCEPETQVIKELLEKHTFALCIAYHSQGEVIYYDYLGRVPQGSRELVKIYSAFSGYQPDYVEGIASYGGFKDYVIHKYNTPALTIELGSGTNPLPLSQFASIFLKNARGLTKTLEQIAQG